MLDFFSSIMSFIQAIWDFFLNLINTLMTLIETLAAAVVLPPLLTGYVWAPIASSIVAVAGFAVAKMIVGRTNV